MKKKILAFVFDGKRFLALRNNPKDPAHGGDYWFTVSGAVESGEDCEDAVNREVKEETGLKVIRVFDLNWGSVYAWNNEDNLERNFIAFVKPGRVLLSEEHIDYAWLDLTNFIKRIHWGLGITELSAVLKKGINRENHFRILKIDEFRKK